MATPRQKLSYKVFKIIQIILCIGELILLGLTIFYMMIFWSDVERDLRRGPDELDIFVTIGQFGTIALFLLVCLWPTTGLIAIHYELLWCQIVHVVLMLTTFMIVHIIVAVCVLIFMTLGWHKSSRRR